MSEYKQPKNTKEYEIIQIIDQGRSYYKAKCHYDEKKYIWFGKVITKNKFLKHYFYSTDLTDAWFYSLDKIQSAISAINTNSIKSIKTINRKS